jgi:succinate dehydrogenase/fumarate reductase flavoprotein subunit
LENTKRLQEQYIDTDVLVIGAGGGGLTAAISAADKGAHVTVCDKGNARRSGGIYAGNDHFFCYLPGIHKPAVRENYIRETLNKGIADEDLVAQAIDHTYDVLQKWESWGINLKTNGHYEFVGHAFPNSTGKMGEPGKTDRMFLHFSDKDACVKLEKQARDRGVQIMNRVMVNELLKDESGRIAGAMGINTRDPVLYIFRAKSIIINKGDVEQNRLYPSPHVRSYGMAVPGTGDGTMAAYRAGADIQHAELCLRQVAQRFGPPTGKGTWIGVTRDCEGKPIAPPYLSKPDPEIGDMAIEDSDAVNHVWNTGKGPVWMDPRGITEEDEAYMRWGFESEAMVPFLRWLDGEKIDIRKTRFEFISLQPRTRIQPRVNINYKTSLDGLYAITPALLSLSASQGMLAGQSAAHYARGVEHTGMNQHQAKIKQVKENYSAILNREGPAFSDWKEAQWAIYQVMQCYALPPCRTENTLMAGYRQLTRIREKARKQLKASNPHELCHCLEVLNLMDIAELVILAVNERRESRGLTRRMDYPFTNPMLNKFLVIKQEQGKSSFRWEIPRRITGK